MIGYKHTEESKRKIVEARRRQVMPIPSVQTRKKMSAWQIGKKLSSDTKIKIGLANKGRLKSVGERKNISLRMKNNKLNLGRKFIGRVNPKPSLETRLKMSLSRRGAKSHTWRGGLKAKNSLVRKQVESKLWRESVFSRDNWTCQKYGTVGGKLHPHHVLNFSSHPKLRFAIDNGITLSKKAHDEFHKKYGYKDNTRKQLQEFLTQ